MSRPGSGQVGSALPPGRGGGRRTGTCPSGRIPRSHAGIHRVGGMVRARPALPGARWTPRWRRLTARSCRAVRSARRIRTTADPILPPPPSVSRGTPLSPRRWLAVSRRTPGDRLLLQLGGYPSRRGAIAGGSHRAWRGRRASFHEPPARVAGRALLSRPGSFAALRAHRLVSLRTAESAPRNGRWPGSAAPLDRAKNQPRQGRR